MCHLSLEISHLLDPLSELLECSAGCSGSKFPFVKPKASRRWLRRNARMQVLRCVTRSFEIAPIVLPDIEDVTFEQPQVPGSGCSCCMPYTMRSSPRRSSTS